MLLLSETYYSTYTLSSKNKRLTKNSLVFLLRNKTKRFFDCNRGVLAVTAMVFGPSENACIRAAVFRVRRVEFNGENYLLAAKKSFSSLAQSSARMPPSTSKLWFNWLTTDRSITLPQAPPRGS